MQLKPKRISEGSRLKPKHARRGMADIKRLPDDCRSFTNLPVRGLVPDAMEAVRVCLEHLGTLTKSRPFSLKAQVTEGGMHVVVKARVFKDGEGTFIDVTRRRGDPILFARVYREIEESLAKHSPAQTPRDIDRSVYAY